MSKARDLASAATAMAAVDATELGYLDGVTSNVQTQLDTNATAVSTAQTTANAALPSTNYFAAGKNKIINGDFGIWQRGTSIDVSANTSYFADRWYGYTVPASTFSSQTTSDTTNLPNIQYCARIQRNSGNTSTGLIQISQSFETINSIPLMGKTVTLSFYARAGANFSAASSQIGVGAQTGTGTDQRIQDGYTGASNFIGSTATLTTTWQRFIFTGTTSSSGTEIGIYFGFNGVGTAGANDYFEITGVQLEAGSIATPFVPAGGGSQQAELALCQRYLPSIIGSSNVLLGFGKSTSQSAALYKFPVTARVAPTGITTSTVGTDFFVLNRSFTSGRPSSISYDFAGTDTAILSINHTAGSPTIALGEPTMLQISSGSGYILFTGCEL